MSFARSLHETRCLSSAQSIYIYISIYPSIHPSIHPSIYLSLSLFVSVCVTEPCCTSPETPVLPKPPLPRKVSSSDLCIQPGGCLVATRRLESDSAELIILSILGASWYTLVLVAVNPASSKPNSKSQMFQTMAPTRLQKLFERGKLFGRGMCRRSTS